MMSVLIIVTLITWKAKCIKYRCYYRVLNDCHIRKVKGLIKLI